MSASLTIPSAWSINPSKKESRLSRLEIRRHHRAGLTERIRLAARLRHEGRALDQRDDRPGRRRGIELLLKVPLGFMLPQEIRKGSAPKREMVGDRGAELLALIAHLLGQVSDQAALRAAALLHRVRALG